jgi:hypothetical protein
MKRVSLAMAFALLLAMSVWAQTESTTPVPYKFEDVKFPGDNFTQLLGINNEGVIAGYHNVNANSGFTLTLGSPNKFVTENFPNSMQTQVIGINNKGLTVGFYIDLGGKTHGFLKTLTGPYVSVDYPALVSGALKSGSVFNQLLGQNDKGQAAGYFSQSIANTTPDFPYIFDEPGHVFQVLTLPLAAQGAQATGINNSQEVCGFYIDKTGKNHGYYISFGTFFELNFPNSIFTQALGINNVGEIVGVYVDTANATHGFLYKRATNTYQSIDDPNGDGVGTTFVNGINDKHQLVGFYGTSPVNTGFVANPE